MPLTVLERHFLTKVASRYRARQEGLVRDKAVNRDQSTRAWGWIVLGARLVERLVGAVFVILITVTGYSLVQTQQRLETSQGELENAKQAADEATARAAELAIRAASLNSALEKANAIGNAGDLATSYIEIGDVLMAQGNLTGALKWYRDGLAVADRLVKADPEDAGWQRNLSISHIKIGDVLTTQGDLIEALTTYQESLAIRDRLAKADFNDANRQRDLAISQGRVAVVLAKQGDTPRALDELRQGRAIISRLVKQSPDNGQLSNDLAAFDQSIATLDQASVPETGSAVSVQVAPPLSDKKRH
jgi:tetratricopeptide (TPR) repeat protein